MHTIYTTFGMQVYLHVHEPYIVQVNGWALALKFCTCAGWVHVQNFRANDQPFMFMLATMLLHRIMTSNTNKC